MDASRNSLATIIMIVILAVLGVIIYRKFIGPRMHKEVAATHEAAPAAPAHEAAK